MTENEIRETLLRTGYFPAELPPPFTSVHFASVAKSFIGSWRRKRQPWTRPDFYSLARKGHQRRPIRIPNCVNQWFLSDVIAKNWDNIESHLKKSTLSLTTSEIDLNWPRAVKITPFRDLPEYRMKSASSHRFILISDITSFYPTIYTHSIPWAIHGKDTAKKDKHHKSKTVWGNALDFALRCGNDGQTIGVPIGPDTSQIVSEIIMTTIDCELQSSLGRRLRGGFRYIDDIFLCFDTHEDAEKALSVFSDAAQALDLQVNVEKTRLIQNIEQVEELWPYRIQDIEISNKKRKQRSDIAKFFSEAFALAGEHDDETIVKYALRVSTSVEIDKDNWDLYEALVVRSALTYPSSMDYASQILIAYNSRGYQLNKVLVGRLITNVITRNAPLGHHSEIAWALWLARCVNLKVSLTAAKVLSNVESSVCALIALDCYKNGLIPRGLDLSLWKQTQCAAGLSDRFWLLAYEANFKGWLPEVEAGFVDNDKFFADVKANGVYFYDEKTASEPFGIARKTFPTYQADDAGLARPEVYSIFGSIVIPYDI